MDDGKLEKAMAEIRRLTDALEHERRRVAELREELAEEHAEWLRLTSDDRAATSAPGGVQERTLRVVRSPAQEALSQYGRDALAAYGWEAQAGMVAEECAELIASLSQYRRGRVGLAAVAEEAADVAITLASVEAHLGARYAAAIAQKLARARKRLDEHARKDNR